MSGTSFRKGANMFRMRYLILPAALLLINSAQTWAQAVTVEGAPIDTGFNVGTVAGFHVSLKGASMDPTRYAVFAEIQYVGTTTVASVQLDREGSANGELNFGGGWPIPADAPTGVYSVKIRVEDRKNHKVAAEQQLRPFAAYRKLVEITGVKLDRTFYTAGDPIQCEAVVQNLTDHPMSGLRVEFSNANYPWISTFSGEANLSGEQHQNPLLGLKVMRDRLDLPARGEVTIPMMPAGTARFLQGTMVALLGAGGPARNFKEPPPEVDQYTVAVWNADRTILYDMHFSKPAIVRPWSSTLPKPYSNLGFTHPYNSDIDFTRYRQFYPPGMISAALTIDPSHTLFRPGDKLQVVANLKNLDQEPWSNAELHAVIHNQAGKQTETVILARDINLSSGETKKITSDAWTIPSDFELGTHKVEYILTTGSAVLARTTGEFAVNNLPRSIMVIAPHEDDEHSYAGLIRAAVEADIPIRVIILTGGDVGECERYYFQACGPNEAREFGQVRMEESAEALEHIGLTRDKFSILGLPDGGSGEIWFRHRNNSNPFLSIYLATDHAPYLNVAKPNLPFAREAVLVELEQLISEFHPDLIATAHPDERHVDHRTTAWFTLKACQELLRQKKISPETIVLADQAYGAGGFKPAPYKYEPAPVYLSGEAAALKQEMGWIYQSQDGNLAEGAKQSFDELPRQEMHYRILDWQEHEGWNEAAVGQ